MGELETALRLEAVGGGRWRGRADPVYEAANGMYGGLTAALLLKAVVSEGTVLGTPSALTVNFVGPIAPGWTADELPEVGYDDTLMDVIGTRAANGTVGSRVNLWSRAGRLLATSEQLCWFR